MRIYNNNTEKKDTKAFDIYTKSIIIGVVFALVFIGSGKLLFWTVNLMLKYWIWIIVFVFVIILIKHFWNRKNKYEGTFR